MDFVWANRKKLMMIGLLAIIVSSIVSFIIPVRFRATTVLFSSEDNNISKSLLSDEPYSKDYLAFGDEKNCEQMMQVLKSSEVMQGMIKKYNLMSYYGIPADAPTKNATMIDYYYDNFSFEITEYQSIKLDVYDKDKEMAANMANGIIGIADSIYRQTVNQRAGAAYRIVAQQYDSMRHQISILEDSMNFFRKLGILNFDNQVKEYTRGYLMWMVKGTPQSIKDIEDKLRPFQVYGKQYWNVSSGLTDAYKWMTQLKIDYIEAKANAEKSIPAFFVAENSVLLLIKRPILSGG